MKKQIACIWGIICIFTCGNLYAIVGGCLQPNSFSFDITGGTHITTTMPPCVSVECPCCDIDSGLCVQHNCTCNAGYYAVNQYTENCSCSVCPANTYSDFASTDTFCTACPNGSMTSGTSASDHDTIGDCKCAQGYYVAGNTCTRCPVAAKTIGGVDVYGTTPDSGYYTITSCYLPAGVYGDGGGTYQMMLGCEYTN